MISKVATDVVFEDAEDPEEYKESLFWQIKQNNVILIVWHNYAVGVLSYEFKDSKDRLYVNAAIIEKGFRGKNLINAIQQKLNQEYAGFDFVYLYDCVGNEFCIPSSLE